MDIGKGTTMAKSLTLGKRVTYRDGNGYEKAAVVVGTRDSVKDGTDVPRPGEDQAHLRVLPPNDSPGYFRASVPLGSGPRTFSL